MPGSSRCLWLPARQTRFAHWYELTDGRFLGRARVSRMRAPTGGIEAPRRRRHGPDMGVTRDAPPRVDEPTAT
ncbi:hypothetical protein BN12_910017 [Nostocoides japonicum T1-X7]|uniref:Uncharacterized protein n=1 Tax=Nostocoides japonicum T1-X7 TaxID=1194083 RepID=A0A077M8R2_9MICO|nr:hypothetical protein BN12_910017 [Tetrasphaera japonica T1-X7]